MAASAGWLVAMTADKVFGYPNSIVGSIGGFMQKPMIKDTLSKIGVTHDAVISGDKAQIYSVFSKFNEQERKILTEELMELQEAFIKEVAQARKIDVKTMRTLATGRIWNGNLALNHKLLDSIGGYNDLFLEIFSDLNVEKLVIEDFPNTISFKRFS